MIATVVRRHEALRRLPKFVLFSASISAFILGLVAYLQGGDLQTLPLEGWFLVGVQVCIFFSAVSLLFSAGAGLRCRVWELTLPLTGRFWWRGHFLSLLLGGMAIILFFPVLPLSIVALDAGYGFDGSWLDFFWKIWGVPFAAYVLVLNFLAIWRADLANPGNRKGWLRGLGSVVIITTGVLVLTSRLGWSWLLLVAVVAGEILRHRVQIPEALALAEEPAPPPELEVWVPFQPRSATFWLQHRIIMRTLFKWPLNWVVLLPFAVGFGMFLGGYFPFGGAPGGMRLANFFMTIYILLSGSGHFIEKFHYLDFLPIDRRLILAWLVVPAVFALTLGYGIGQWRYSIMRGEEEPFSFVNEGDDYGLKIPPPLFRLHRGQTSPDIIAPWGETHPAESVTAWKGLSWQFYKPFSTPSGASEEFVAWQIQRASETFFGETVSTEEISRRYLEIGSNGDVRVVAAGLNLQADHLQWTEKSGGPVLPVLLGAVVVAYLMVLALLFRLQRRITSTMKQRATFWAMMGFLMVLHLGWLTGFISRLSDDWIVNGVFQGVIQRWSQSSSGTAVVAYLAALVLTALAWALALRQFRQLEVTKS